MKAKLIISLLVSLISSICVNAQNVGIGTSNPATQLHIVSPQSSILTVEGPTNLYNSIIENGVYRGYWGSYSGANEDMDFGTGTGNTVGKLHLTIQAAPKLSIDAAGYVGIGTQSPAVPLHLVTTSALQTMRIDGGTGMHIGFFESGANRGYLGSFSGAAQDIDFGTSGVNASGKVHLTTQANPRLTVQPDGNVGIGTTTPSQKLDVNGNLELGGALFVNGSSGTTDQVLVSNGAGAPSWQTRSTAFDNNIRFSFSGSNNTNTSGNLTINTRYNTNPAMVAVSGTSITFNQTGIYHFEGAISGGYLSPSTLSYVPGLSINLYLNGGVGPGNNPVGSVNFGKAVVTNRYGGTVYFKADLYITAGQVLNCGFNYYDEPAGYTLLDTFGYLRGYLISN